MVSRLARAAAARPAPAPPDVRFVRHPTFRRAGRHTDRIRVGRPRPAADPPGRQRWHCARRSAWDRRRTRPAARRVMGGAGPATPGRVRRGALGGAGAATPRASASAALARVHPHADPLRAVACSSSLRPIPASMSPHRAGTRSRRGRGVQAGRVRCRRALTSVAAVEVRGRPASSPPRAPRPGQVVVELGELVELVATELVGISVVPVREATTRLSRG